MIRLEELNDDYFEIVHLNRDYNLSGFKCEKGEGLEYYLKKCALPDEESNISRTYLILSKDSKKIVAYFTLRTGLITVSRGFLKGFDAHTGIELANFAVNDNYDEAHDEIPKLGSYVFACYILPIIQEISKYIGSKYLYIFALPKNRLLEHYKKMGFQRTSIKMERFVYRHVKPAYDKDCIFMYQVI
jgi:hypothetical protein